MSGLSQQYLTLSTNICLRVSFALKKNAIIMATLIKENHLIGVVYIFRCLAYYHHGATQHGGVQTDMVLER